MSSMSNVLRLCPPVPESLSQKTVLSELAHAISSRRADLKISTAEVASLTKLTTADIVALEAGEWDIDLASLLLISQLLNLNLSSLLRKTLMQS